MTALPRGFAAAGAACGIKKNGAPDLALVVAECACPAAALFTRCRLVGAHITHSRAQLAASGGLVRAVLVNSGNANCATGEAGVADAARIASHAAELIGCPPQQVLFWSTGVIGARLPAARILDALPALVAAAGTDGADAFARAIMTTDTRPKAYSCEAGAAHVTGIAKGAGMIHPDMATMLAFLLTDAPLAQDPQLLLESLVARTFHCVSVDGDTSPNDSVLLWSSGAAGAAGDLRTPLLETARTLCRAIARDGEGATRLVTVRVHGAPSDAAATLVGRTIATSPLVKTAVYGRDPNWGRIVSAAGRSGVAFAPERVSLSIGDAVVFALGQPQPHHEPQAHRHLAERDEVVLTLDLGMGKGSAECWTCDFSEDYVRVNASYRS